MNGPMTIPRSTGCASALPARIVSLQTEEETRCATTQSYSTTAEL
jgi:hypothetical protein